MAKKRNAGGSRRNQRGGIAEVRNKFLQGLQRENGKGEVNVGARGRGGVSSAASAGPEGKSALRMSNYIKRVFVYTLLILQRKGQASSFSGLQGGGCRERTLPMVSRSWVESS